MSPGVGDADGDGVALGVGEAVGVAVALGAGVGTTAAGPLHAASRMNATINERAITP